MVPLWSHRGNLSANQSNARKWLTQFHFQEHALVIVHTIFFLRFLAYRFLTTWISSPWITCPIDLAHGVTFGLMWAASASSANAMAPAGMTATLQVRGGIKFYIFYVSWLNNCNSIWSLTFSGPCWCTLLQLGKRGWNSWWWPYSRSRRRTSDFFHPLIHSPVHWDIICHLLMSL